MRKSVLLARQFGLPALLAATPLAMAALPSVALAAAPENSARAYADITVTGQVNDEKGEGLPGVTVIVKGTTNGASTDATGKFTLTVSSTATLVLSSVGYVSQEVAVAGHSTLTVQLKPTTQDLN